jgi:hypothetical protein
MYLIYVSYKLLYHCVKLLMLSCHCSPFWVANLKNKLWIAAIGCITHVKYNNGYDIHKVVKRDFHIKRQILAAPNKEDSK